MRNQNSKPRIFKGPPFEKWYSYLVFIVAGYFIADLVILSYRDLMLPSSAPSTQVKQRPIENITSRGAYNTIISRNIFSSKGEILDPLYLKNGGELKNDEMPVPSSLPLTLIGTLVHSRPEKSIAAIDIKGKNNVIAYSPDRDIENLAKVVSIERQRVIIRNMNTNRLEFIEMKSDRKISFGANKSAGTSSGGGSEVQRTGSNEFTIKRADLNKYLTNMQELVMQAKSVPNRDPVTGEINGFRLVDFAPDSIFGQLGIPKGAVINAVNGNTLDSYNKAMEVYNATKNSPKISILVDINGKKETLTYNISN